MLTLFSTSILIFTFLSDEIDMNLIIFIISIVFLKVYIF